MEWKRMERTRNHTMTGIYAFGLHNYAGGRPCQVASGRTEEMKL